jgi:predicted ATPase
VFACQLTLNHPWLPSGVHSLGCVHRWSDVTAATDTAKSMLTGPSLRGIYMWGGVGVGKTMLMDLFVESAPRHFRVHRIHFHDLMLEVHMLLRNLSGEQVCRRTPLVQPLQWPPLECLAPRHCIGR